MPGMLAVSCAPPGQSIRGCCLTRSCSTLAGSALVFDRTPKVQAELADLGVGPSQGETMLLLDRTFQASLQDAVSGR